MCIRDRFVLGMLCLRAGFASKGEHYLRLFLKRLHQGRKATALSLSGEIAIAQAVSYTHLRAHETVLDLVCRLLLEINKRSALC